MKRYKARHPSRRDFFRDSLLGSAAFFVPGRALSNTDDRALLPEHEERSIPPSYSERLDLSPARWIWLPSERTLQNTFLLFRKSFRLTSLPLAASGWILADSRYKLYVNGNRVQFGPAPSDPRWPEADPVDISPWLKEGENVLGAEVLYYGTGEGTWPAGKPGLIMNIGMKSPDGNTTRLITDDSWQVIPARSWQSGHYKRWFLRALQEEFDAGKYPYGWNEPGFKDKEKWYRAADLDLEADKPSICSGYPDYLQEIQGDISAACIRKRSIPLMKEELVMARGLADSFRIRWQGRTSDYFDFLVPGNHLSSADFITRTLPGNVQLTRIDINHAAIFTYEFEEQVVGFPFFTIEAPAGTIVELMVQEGHQPGLLSLMNNRLHSWTRFICREGTNRFETFDYESLRWIQLHIHGRKGKIRVQGVGVRRRQYNWPREPVVSCSDVRINRVIQSAVNTLRNSAQDIMVDGMGRERQQYSGDCGHQIHPVCSSFGNFDLPVRYMNTFSQGLTKEGYFMDSWPAYDRLARIAQRQLDFTPWGPIIDHGIGFVFDCYHTWMYTGNRQALTEVYPRLLRFYNFLVSLTAENGLLPVEQLGVPTVWMDTDAYLQQRHKQCAFNLYAAAMMMHALPVLCRVSGDSSNEKIIRRKGEEILERATEAFWSQEKAMFVANLPWLEEEGEARLCELSLAMSVLFDQCPGKDHAASVDALVTLPAHMGKAYPANAGWRHRALGKAGKTEAILEDLRTRWWSLPSVQQNNTLQEHWHVRPDSRDQWSHCPVAPLYAMHLSVAGISPLEPGYKKVRIVPGPGWLENLSLVNHTPSGPIRFASGGRQGNRLISLLLPDGCSGELVLHKLEEPDLPLLEELPDTQQRVFSLESGQTVELKLKYT